MNDPTPLDDLIADDLLLDRLASRHPAGDEPVAALLCAVAAHADRPLTGRTRRRRPHGRRLLAAFAVITVGASGAGVAAAVTLPSYLPGAAERARVERMMDANAASNRPSVLLSRLGIPDDADLGAERGLVLVRRADGRIVLVPAAAASRAGEFSGAAAAFAIRDLAGLTGTPQVPGSQLGIGSPGGSASMTDEPGEQPASDNALVADADKPTPTNSGKTGKALAKGKTVTVTPPTPPTPPVPEPPTPTETPTETLALVAPDPTTDDATSKKSKRSAQGDPAVQSDGTDGTDGTEESAPSGQQAHADQPDQPDQPGLASGRLAGSAAGSVPAKETTDTPPAAQSGQAGRSNATKPAATGSGAEVAESDPSG